LRRAFLGALHVVAFIAFPAAIGIALVAADFTVGLLGEKWIPMIPALQILAIGGLARALGGTTGPLFEAIGRPDIGAKFSMGQLAVLAALLYPAVVAYGITGAAAAETASLILSFAPALVVAFRRLSAHLSQAMQTVGYPLANSLVMAVVVTGSRGLPIEQPTVASLVVLTTIGIATYAGSVALSMRFFGYRAPGDVLARIRGGAK
jgi:PST family polysaccharide transporter/lipopolysaccharide exporter